MAARVWPVDAVAGSPSNPGRALRQTTVSPFVAQGSTSRPLGGTSGVRPGTPTNIVTATSTTWTVTPFIGVIDGEAAAIAGAYSYSFDTNQTGSVTAAAGSARIDRLDVQVSDPAESDGTSTPGIAIVYTAGTAGSGLAPLAPARTHPLALINVPASGGGSPSVTWMASYFAAAGGAVPFPTYNSGANPLTGWTTASYGQAALVVGDSTAAYNRLWYFNGTSWTHSLNTSTPFAMAAGSGSNTSSGSVAVSFPSGRFTVAPLVTMANTGSTVSALNASSITSTGANMGGFNAAGSAIVTSFMWTAVQMTATTAAG